MAKRGTTKKPGKGARGKADAAKPSAEQLSDRERQRLLLHHKRKVKPLIESEKNAKASVKKAIELAKKEGVTKKDLLLAIQLETEEGREKLQAEIQALLDVDRHTAAGVGEQLELFAMRDSKERSFEDGRIAALDDKPAKPPGHLSSAAEKHWLDGHSQGLKEITTTCAKGFRPLSEVVSRIVPAPTDLPDNEAERDAA